MTENQKNPFEDIEIPDAGRLKSMSVGELVDVCASVRRVIAAAVAANGGHLASNMGVVELTVALHRVFDFPPDRLVFDVGHQCYTHKILTGRSGGFRHLRNPGGVSGFPDPREHETDLFLVGHAGTSISTATGLADAISRLGEEGRVVALVGDASIQNGMSLEALNHLGENGHDVLVVLNDNEMGISPTVGAISGSVSRLRTDARYNRLKTEAAGLLEKIPFVGKPMEYLGAALSDALKRALSPGAIFEILGIDYYGPVDGHDLSSLIPRLQEMSSLRGPRVLHVITKKGCGHDPAECDPTGFHSAPATVKSRPGKPDVPATEPPRAPAVDIPEKAPAPAESPAYSKVFGSVVSRLMEEDERVVAVTAAMLHGTGLDEAESRFRDRVFDVGIAEGHAVGFAAGMARGGLKPVCAIYSTFLQRAVDQVFHEICIQENLGLALVLDRAGVVGGDGPTHQGVYDIAYLGSFPRIVLAAPRDARMLDAMLRQALDCNAPYVIRFPKDVPPEPIRGTGSLKLGRGEILKEGSGEAALAGYGAAVEWCLAAAELLNEQGIDATVADLRFARPLDGELLETLASGNRLLVTVEDGIVDGGVGQAAAALLLRRGLAEGTRLVTLGINDGMLPHAGRGPLLETLGLSPRAICETVSKALSE